MATRRRRPGPKRKKPVLDAERFPASLAWYEIPELFRRFAAALGEDWGIVRLQRLEATHRPFWVPLAGYVPFGDDTFGHTAALYWPEGPASAPLVVWADPERQGLVVDSGSVEGWLRRHRDEARAQKKRKRLRLLEELVPPGPVPGPLDAIADWREIPLFPELEPDPDHPFFLARAAERLALWTGRLDEAERLLRAALARMPEYTAARIDLARLLARRGDPRVAMEAALALLSPALADGRSWWEETSFARGRDGWRAELLGLLRGLEKPPGAIRGDPRWRAARTLELVEGSAGSAAGRYTQDSLERLLALVGELDAAGDPAGAARVHLVWAEEALPGEPDRTAGWVTRQAALYEEAGDPRRALHLRALASGSA